MSRHRVLALSAGRANGNSEMLLRHALAAMAPHCEIQPELIRLQSLDIRQCAGCESCMKQLIAGGEGRCVLKGDDFGWLLEQLAQADAVLLGVPIYDLIPCGTAITLLNRALGAGKSYQQACRDKPKVCAAIAVGGSDWTELTEPLLQISLTNLCKGGHVVDRMVARHNTAPAMVLLDDAVLKRAALVGKRVAMVLQDPSQTGYQGENGVCPACHCSLLQVGTDGGVSCPFCGVKGTLAVQDGLPEFTCTDNEIAENRFTPAGTQSHREDIARMHKKAAEGREDIQQRQTQYESIPVLHK